MYVPINEANPLLSLRLEDSLTLTELRSNDLFLITRWQTYANPIEIHEAFPESWFVFFRSDDHHPIQLKSRNQDFSLTANTALFLPPYSLAHWQIPAGAFVWQAYRSRLPLPGSLGNTPFRLHWPPGLTFTESSDLVAYLGSIKKRSIPIPSEFTHSDLAREAKYWLDSHFQNNFSLNLLSEKLGVSGSSLSHCFSQCYNLSPITYRNHLRLHHAAMNLGHEGHSVTDSCFASGFEDFSRFFRNFRTYFGVPPSRFLQKNLFLK